MSNHAATVERAYQKHTQRQRFAHHVDIVSPFAESELAFDAHRRSHTVKAWKR